MADIVFLVRATIIDLGIGALLIGVSGFVFGPDPKSAHGGRRLVAQAVVWLPAGVAFVVIPAL